MTDTPPAAGIGKRIAMHRRLAGLSARELAERAGRGLTRGVIANVESGRKADITVNQLLAISNVLGLPPLVLALPADESPEPVSSLEVDELAEKLIGALKAALASHQSPERG